MCTALYLCTTPGQKGGWVPGQVISWNETSGIANEAYTVKELDVNSGDVLLGTFQTSNQHLMSWSSSSDSYYTRIFTILEYYDLIFHISSQTNLYFSHPIQALHQ